MGNYRVVVTNPTGATVANYITSAEDVRWRLERTLQDYPETRVIFNADGGFTLVGVDGATVDVFPVFEDREDDEEGDSE